jgi:hypothetical protein
MLLGSYLLFRNEIHQPAKPVIDSNTLKEFIHVERITPADSGDADLIEIQREIDEADSLERSQQRE